MGKSTTPYWNALAEEHRGSWRAVPGLEGSAEQLTLSLDPANGEITRLTRFLPGADTTACGSQCHPYPEEVLILRGSLHDAAFDRWLREGDYTSRPPGEVHGPFRTEEGCLVLEVSFPARSGGGPQREPGSFEHRAGS
ncbi:MAG: cupin domain-containing protein [Prochlorococcaceae cyanobacterium]|jgi:hypothetical protein